MIPSDGLGWVMAGVVLMVAVVSAVVPAVIGCAIYRDRGGPASRLAVSVIGPLAILAGVALSLMGRDIPGNPVLGVSIAIAAYGSVLVGLVLAAQLEASERGQWLRRRGAVFPLLLSVVIAAAWTGAAVGVIVLCGRAERAARSAQRERESLYLQSRRCTGDSRSCAEGWRPDDYCGGVKSVAVTADGAYAAAVGDELRVWDVTTLHRIGNSLMSGNFVAIAKPIRTESPKVAVCRGWSCELLTAGASEAPVSIAECSDGNVPADTEPRAPLAFAPGSRFAVAGAAASRFVVAGDGICTHELSSGMRQRRFAEGCVNRYDAVALSSSGDRVAAICDRAVTFWAAATGARLEAGAPRTGPVRSRSALAFSQDGRDVVVLAQEARTDVLYAFDVTDGSQRARVEIGRGSRGRPFAVLYNGRVLVGGDHSCLWDLTEKRLLGCAVDRADAFAAPITDASPMIAIVAADARRNPVCATASTLQLWTSYELTTWKLSGDDAP
jgi:hypothetical protein